MSEFQELIKKFDKCRDYVRDFFVYGFKSRNDFSLKSARTYDDERRRIESWLSEYVKEDYTQEKNISLQMDSNLLDTNPLYRVWKTKSFTDYDILLHFYLLDILENASTSHYKSINELADTLLEKYDLIIDVQMIRRKCNEYVAEGLFVSKKEGKTLVYAKAPSLADYTKGFTEDFINALRFFQLSAPFGILGSTLLDQQLERNQIFRIKHSFMVHTLEDEILLDLLQAMKNEQYIMLHCRSNKNDILRIESGIPLRIFVSTKTGRRYLCFYHFTKSKTPASKIHGRFHSLRLDQIKKVEPVTEKNGTQEQLAECSLSKQSYSLLKEKLNKNQSRLWGVSFSSDVRPSRNIPTAPRDTLGREQLVVLTLHIDEQRESYILKRLEREGRNGTITHLAPNTYQYEKVVFDAYEMLPWFRSFLGRILDLKVYAVNNNQVSPTPNHLFSQRFQKDLNRMYEMYDIE